ncbi:bifunctional DNA-formamidopyrimidine glycosylase/DNA-(apurinic or apyrimidinic site) lyase [Limibaculum sp. FT325]|uniref:bifunctional DNA-formamidopyrimidine glycosylase/DNA-(apurinic or apyrimidinic site) lyase n=1 Tax=Thermohalobaculum sediminis TaxID=2939436 RepID=UPI00209B988A|nr:bifunctional DNA-formamidopyrimidine glycosylase/DNA-(apurinic or apyrimidinic site) lyase [Limibaculum sediminis]MCL5777679.1 bifunctional DNA-formamidopyrimidine glycosylase/DNA-(apurinic or apyrimidinic site) lyase [Limibaculum sediminis]
MPELPEVETVRRGLEPVLAGHVLARVEQRRADLRWPLPERFAERLTGRRVGALGRRSKFILASLDGDETWLIHLGMTGRVLIEGRMMGEFHHATPAPGPHDHVILTTGDGVRIVYNDARRFGAMDLWPTESLSAHPWLARLGPEPLGNDFSAPVLAARLAGRMTPIKAALLDQRTVAGLGNIYVSEALHRAGIHPARMAGAISAARIERLVAEIRATLSEAIAAGGSSLRDYRQADGELGYFQHAFLVYDRDGEPCRRQGCAGTIRRIVQAGRSTFYCAKCQH